MTKSEGIYRILHVQNSNYFLRVNFMQFYRFISTTRHQISFLSMKRNRSNSSIMSFIAIQKLKLFIKKRQFSIFRHRGKIPISHWKLHGINSIKMMWNYFVYLPILSIPNYYTWSLFTKSWARRCHKFVGWTTTEVLDLVGMTI